MFVTNVQFLNDQQQHNQWLLQNQAVISFMTIVEKNEICYLSHLASCRLVVLRLFSYDLRCQRLSVNRSTTLYYGIHVRILVN